MTRARYIKGTATHRRTESDYMAAMLDSVTLEDWRDIIGATVQAAKSGDAQARAFIASYLVGRPEAKAPTAVSVVVAQLSGKDPVVDLLAQPHISAERYPILHADDDEDERIRAAVAAELAKLEAPKSAR